MQEKKELNIKLDNYLKENSFYVLKLRAKNALNKIAPKGSDILEPSIWKNSHWRWYLEDVKGIVFENYRR